MVVKYSYQIKSVLQDSKRNVLGFRVVTTTDTQFFTVDVPAELFDYNTLAYVKFRIRLFPFMDVRNLPRPLQNKIRIPLGDFLDRWMLENYDGNRSKRKDSNT